ncbi:hypothetical protein ASZ78_003087 [Callipepla squamata]|uniref:E3 ubiquitin-protein ligase listerin n=1 Tax=Callipepla squamata TaxID=9009 RepID=A0A226MXN9_CALSU|nr:hypothetical protein ASZ78_003087 [Callipepla squamata]
MGGKNKQRTKGNVRPSSSGRAAELLAKERGTVPGFIGFGTSQSDLGYVPAVQGAEEIDSLVDADFRMVLRKLSKRDIITKLKAMQEFGTMCKEREAEVVKGVLPYWPRIYCKISLDHDRRVREATQQSFEQLILKVKKHLAPYLKSIMGYWLIAQCDTYSPAASAAKEAFEKAFPSSKQPEALAFCKDEILNVLQDHLLKETPDTLSDPHIDDSDAVVCPALWEAVLCAIATIEDCWSHVNARKGVLPKLWTVLREGGRGLATVIYPNILPFISKVPPGITEPRLEYFRTFFSSIIQGLSNERALASPSESSAIITAFMECLRFVVLQKTGEDEWRQMHQMLIYEQLIPLTDAVLQEPRLQHGPLFYQIAETLSSWEAKAEVSSDDNTNEVYQKLLSNFWDRLLKMCILHVDKLEADEKTLFAISDMLEVLQNPKTVTKLSIRKSLKVKFSDEDESERNMESGKMTEVRSSTDSEIQADLQYSSILRKEPLENLVCNLSELSIVYVNEQKSEQHLKFLSALLNNFSSNRVFQVLLEQGTNTSCPLAESQEDIKVNNENPSVQFLYMNLITWLKEDWRTDMHFLVDILYSVLNCCNSNDERKIILDDLTKMDLKWIVFLQIIQKDLIVPDLFAAFFVFLSLQVLISAVSDLLSTLLEADIESGCLVGAYVEHVMPNRTEWEKLREALSAEWMHKPLLEGRLSMNCEHLGSCVKLCGTTKLPGHLCTSALLSKMVLLILENDMVKGNEEAERKKMDNITVNFVGFFLVAELLYSLQWIEELENPPYLLLEYLHMLEEMGITYEKFSALSNTTNLQQTIFDRSEEHGRLWSLTLAKVIHGENAVSCEMKKLFKTSEGYLNTVAYDLLSKICIANIDDTTSENHSLYHVPLVQIFACVSCDLASALSAYFEPAAPKTTENLPVNLVSEWKEFFSEGIHNLLLPLLVKITGETKTAAEGSFQNSVLTSLGEALTYISRDQLLNHKLPAKFVAGQKTNLPDNLQTLLNTLSPLLLFRARSVQISVYHMLYKLMPELPKFDDEDLKSYGDEEEELALYLRVLYSQYLRRTKSLNRLLYHLFRLMPENPVFSGVTSEVPNKDTKTFFTEELHLDVKGTGALSSQIPHLACSVYHITLKDLPAMVRLWWNSCEKRVFNVVDKFTSKYVSSVLSSQEISSVQTSTQLFNGMTVKARSAAREVIATYSVDDIFIELIIQLPSNYPLGSITVESGKRVGVAVQQWRNWMLQLSTYLTHQNGSIMEGLSLWKNNVDKRFEGIEDCMICFSVIHGSNYSLPKKACRTCKKKFHSACLMKMDKNFQSVQRCLEKEVDSAKDLFSEASGERYWVNNLASGCHNKEQMEKISAAKKEE